MKLAREGGLRGVVAHVEVGVGVQFVNHWSYLPKTWLINQYHDTNTIYLGLLDGTGQDRGDLLKGLGHVESDVGDAVRGHLKDGRQQLPLGDVRPAGLAQHVDAEEAGHAMQVVLVSRHRDNLGDDRLLGPVSAELFHQLLQVVGCCLPEKKCSIIELQLKP